MKDKNLVINAALAEITIEDFQHPGLRLARFIFTDDLPNENGMGIKQEEFADIIKSSVGAPFKMKFLGEGVGGHTGSIPIGYIREMFEQVGEDGSNQLVAVSTLFADEYPDEVAWLEKKLDQASKGESDPPGVSWELSYHDSILEQGVNWLKGLITRAATVVGDPAYGKRTAILALASNQEVSDDEFMTQLSEITNNDSPKIPEQGGNINMEEELKVAKEALEAAQAQLAEAQKRIGELEGENDSLQTTITEKDTALAEYAKQDLILARTQELVEAGITLPEDVDKLAKKQEFYASMTEEAFAEYKEDLVTNIASASKPDADKSDKTALASRLQPKRLPRLGVSTTASSDDKVDLTELAGKFSNISRTRAVSTEAEE